MKDIFSSKKPEQEVWLEIMQQCSVLISRLMRILASHDAELTKNLQALHHALSNEESLDCVSGLIAVVTEQFSVMEENVLSGYKKDDDWTNEQIKLIGDILIVLLDRINFPVQYAPKVKMIKTLVSKEGRSIYYHSLLAGMTALAELLTEIFDTVREDKDKIQHYLQHITVELQHFDAGLVASGKLNQEKEHAGINIKTKVETEVRQLGNSITTLVDIEDMKSEVQKSMDAICVHMDNYRKQEQERNQKTDGLINGLTEKLKLMDEKCEQLKLQVLKKQQQVMSDSLTGLRNRLAYEEAIQFELKRFARYERPLSLLVLDLDNFKKVNDTYGHSAGDKALQHVAGILAHNIRSVDFLARYGGEEFVIILPELQLDAAKTMAQKICHAVKSKQPVLDGHTITLTVSGGVAQLHQGDSAETLFERADTALYLAKERGRDRVEVE